MKFGAFIKKRRLEKKMGLRRFASAIGADAGNWCKIEKGTFPAPGDIHVLNRICEVLDISKDEEDKLFDLAAKDSKEKVPADIKAQIQENEIVPILFRTLEKKKLSSKKMKELVKRIQDEY